MDNNYPQNNPYNTNQGYPQQPVPQYNSQYPGVAPQQTTAPEAPAYANPYATTAPEAPAYANPYATTAPEAPAYADPYATTAPAYTDPYATTAPAYADPYGVPAPAPKKSKKGLIIGLIAGGVVLIGIIVAVLLYFNSNSYKYGEAKDLMKEGKYNEAITAFTEIKNYKDSADLIDECNYKKAEDLFADKKYEEALDIYRDLDGYEDSDSKRTECSRRILYAYVAELDESDEDVRYYSGSTFYLIGVDDEEELLKFWYMGTNEGFNITIDMTSDDGEFFYIWDPTYGTESMSSGDCVISELNTVSNSLTIDSYYGSSMPYSTNTSCNYLCQNLASLLDETDLGLSPADLGFTGIE